MSARGTILAGQWCNQHMRQRLDGHMGSMTKERYWERGEKLDREEMRISLANGRNWERDYAYRETKVSQSIRMQQRLHAVSPTDQKNTILYSVRVVIVGSEPRYSEPQWQLLSIINHDPGWLYPIRHEISLAMTSPPQSSPALHGDPRYQRSSCDHIDVNNIDFN